MLTCLFKKRKNTRRKKRLPKKLNKIKGSNKKKLKRNKKAKNKSHLWILLGRRRGTPSSSELERQVLRRHVTCKTNVFMETAKQI
jgi:hypothetical protein